MTRAAVRLAGGAAGFAYVLGRDRAKARLIALSTRCWQCRGMRDAVEAALVAPSRRGSRAERGRRPRAAAATRVDFFTMVRGED